LESKGLVLDEMEQLLHGMRDMQAEFEPEQSQMNIPLSYHAAPTGPASAFFQGA
jgi:hypothetical protein